MIFHGGATVAGDRFAIRSSSVSLVPSVRLIHKFLASSDEF